MSEPQILVGPSDDSVDVDVSDLVGPRIPHECPHCSGDLSAHNRRVENSTWRAARKTFADKAKRAAEAKPKQAPAPDRLAALEALVTSALPMLLPLAKKEATEP